MAASSSACCAMYSASVSTCEATAHARSARARPSPWAAASRSARKTAWRGTCAACKCHTRIAHPRSAAGAGGSCGHSTRTAVLACHCSVPSASKRSRRRSGPSAATTRAGSRVGFLRSPATCSSTCASSSGSAARSASRATRWASSGRTAVSVGTKGLGCGMASWSDASKPAPCARARSHNAAVAASTGTCQKRAPYSGSTKGADAAGASTADAGGAQCCCCC